MIKENTLPPGRETRYQGRKVRTKDWSGLAPGTQIQSILGYVYEVGLTERHTIGNKVLSMLTQKNADAKMMIAINEVQAVESIFAKMTIKKVHRSKDDKRWRSDEPQQGPLPSMAFAEHDESADESDTDDALIESKQVTKQEKKLRFKTMRKK